MAEAKFITPAKAARGLGSARSGTHHFIQQRVSALALIVLVPWFVYSMLTAGQADYESARAFVAKPWNAALLLLTAGATFYHMRLGIQTVIEDYISKPGTKGFLLVLNSFASIALFAITAMAVLKIWIDMAAG